MLENNQATFLKFPLRLLTFFFYIQATISSALTPRGEALTKFGDCLEQNSDLLEVRDLNDFYRIRGIPEECCASLATNIFPAESTELLDGIDKTDCRINAFFIPEGIFDPHNHPLEFVSYIVSGGYTQTIFNLQASLAGNSENTCEPCVPTFSEHCAAHSRIYTKNDEIQELGTVKLVEVQKEAFSTGDLVSFMNTKAIHTINDFNKDTLTVNHISKKGDGKIDVFVLHSTPDREVLTKAATRTPIPKEVSSLIIKKSISFFRTVEVEKGKMKEENINNHSLESHEHFPNMLRARSHL